MAAFNNRALCQEASGVPGAVRSKTVPAVEELGDDKVLIKVHAWAINPADAILQDRNLVNYPVILGCDVAGTIEAVAPGAAAASKFRVGDRVFGVTANNGFQDYVVLEGKLIAKIPSQMAYREAVVFGLASVTTAMFLFSSNYLQLDYPKVGSPNTKDKSVLVWGGSSALGSNAIQLAAAAGYEVITTCSKKNISYVKDLGAVEAFDYRDPSVTEQLGAELDKTECAGVFMAAGMKDGNVAACKAVAATKQQLNLATSSYIESLDDVPEGVSVKQPSPSEMKPFPYCWFETLPTTFGGYMAEVIANGLYKVAPAPLVVNKRGVEGIQEAVDLMRVISENGLEGVKESVAEVKAMIQENRSLPVKLVVERPLSR